jgi:tetratricopeptide (TPR) repeat protein
VNARWLALVALLATPSAGAAGVDDVPARLTLRACAAAVREESVRLCRQALELGLSPRRAAVAQRLLGRSLADLLRWDEAVAAYREALRLEPADAEAALRLGLALSYGLGRPGEAEPLLREAVSLCPGQADYRVELAVVLNALERHLEAESEFQQALALDGHALDSRPAAQATYLASLRQAPWP